MPGRQTVFGPFELDADAGTLLRKGEPVPIGYRGFLLLSALVERPGEVLTKSDLIDTAWRGAAVEETNLSVQIAALRKALGPGPNGGEWIATIPRVGYRFVGAVERARRVPDSAGNPSVNNEISSGPSIAVLPFVNLSDDREQEYFADGIVEEIITALSRLRWLFVIARNSSFAYKGRAVDVKQIGQDLRVRYVLEGSVRKAGNRVRIGGQLVHTSTGAHLWADRFEGAMEDIFDLQDHVTSSVVAAIAPKLEQAEIERVKLKPTGASTPTTIISEDWQPGINGHANQTRKLLPLRTRLWNSTPISPRLTASRCNATQGERPVAGWSIVISRWRSLQDSRGGPRNWAGKIPMRFGRRESPLPSRSATSTPVPRLSKER
jgi:TolB-like protein